MKLEQALQTNKFRNNLHKAGLNILYTAWWLKSSSSNVLKTFDLTHEQYNVLRILNGKHPNKMCVKDIAERMIEKNSNVPRIIDKLEIKKFIIRTQGKMDGRQTEISLTQNGIDVLGKTTAELNKFWDSSLSLDESEALMLNELLEKLRQKD